MTSSCRNSQCNIDKPIQTICLKHPSASNDWGQLRFSSLELCRTYGQLVSNSRQICNQDEPWRDVSWEPGRVDKQRKMKQLLFCRQCYNLDFLLLPLLCYYPLNRDDPSHQHKHVERIKAKDELLWWRNRTVFQNGEDLIQPANCRPEKRNIRLQAMPCFLQQSPNVLIL